MQRQPSVADRVDAIKNEITAQARVRLGERMKSLRAGGCAHTRSKRERRDGGRLRFSTTDRRGLYLDCTGFAAARIEVRAFRVQIMPDFAMLMVCCSMT
jgi:hypothetical protein